MDKDDKCGVYELSCGTCQKIYIGQIGRSFKERLLEHERSFYKNDDKSKYSSHILQENHLFNSEFKILHVSSKGLLLNALESVNLMQENQ